MNIHYQYLPKHVVRVKVKKIKNKGMALFYLSNKCLLSFLAILCLKKSYKLCNIFNIIIKNDSKL